MNKILLFDQDLKHYRKSIYLKLSKHLNSKGYILEVFCDEKLNNPKETFFHGVPYTFNSLRKILAKEKPYIVIQFIWLRYPFLIPLMLWMKIKSIPIILWSHGINLQKRNQIFKNQLYYLRQKLADCLILYSKNELNYIRTHKEKVFIANNTLDLYGLPSIMESKNELKSKYGLNNKKVILSVARFNVNNRKVDHLIKLSSRLEYDCEIVLIGPGISLNVQKIISNIPNITYLGPIYDQKKVCEFYKLSDLFIMPGAIGLAINQAFYFKTPVVVEDCAQGPEIQYLKDGKNGFIYNGNDSVDLVRKTKLALSNELNDKFSEVAYETILKFGTLDQMFKGFIEAIEYVESKKNS